MNKKFPFEIVDLLKKTDHTLLSPAAKIDDIINICKESIEFSVASACIPPCYVAKMKNLFKENLTICTVIGFPNGYCTSETKFFEAKNALANGADEIDMVINLTDLKSKNFDKIEYEISKIKQICDRKILKVIIECCLLNDSEKIKMCKIVEVANADFIKTSTGFSCGGAIPKDVEIIKRNIPKHIKIKAAGGINSLDDAKRLISSGADRLGSSKIVNLIKNLYC